MTSYDLKRWILALAIQAEIEGMKAHNLALSPDETYRAYNKEHFDDKARELRELAERHDHQL